MPADERPMSHGWQDRYGNLDIHDATGFFPIEHLIQLPPPDADQRSRGKFTQSINPPVANAPDSKMMCRVSKYGNIILQSDMGYQWKNEFDGDFDADEQFEIDRWLYLQKLLHEDDGTTDPDWHDQRRMVQLTRYGHKFEMRDVGWNKTRENEYSAEKKDIGNGEDERWVKLRTKGGMLIQASDIGMDPENDEYTKRLLLEEIGDIYLDEEDKFDKTSQPWNQYGTRDMRMLRFVTRSGIKIVMDDRGSHDGGEYLPPFSSSAESRLNEEIGIGVLVKGRASPGTKLDYATQGGDPTGYYWQFDERPDHNSTAWGTPMGQVMGMDDNEEYLAICSRLPELPTDWKYLSDNEFLEQSVESLLPHTNTHHLIIDHGRELIRLKSRAGAGDPSRTQKLGASASGEHAGIEIHDAPSSDPWTELIDIDKRGLWFSRQEGVGIWRGKEGSNIYVWLDDSDNNIILRNASAGGKVQIYCAGNVDVISDRVVGIQANQIHLNAATEIRLSAGGTNYTFDPGALRIGGDVHAPNVFARFPTAEKPIYVSGRGTGQQSGGGSPASNLQVEALPSRQEPDNRL
jgi:hypothetical protein